MGTKAAPPVLASTSRAAATLTQLGRFSQVMMTGSDVAVVGMVGTKCFAFDYYLMGRASCDASGSQVQP